MICANCKAKIDADATFCPRCGTKFDQPLSVTRGDNTNLNKKSSNWWCDYLIGFTKFFIIAEIIVAEIAGIILIFSGIASSGIVAVLGIVLMILGPIIALLTNAVIMIFANMAKDVTAIKDLLGRKE
ncbi:MAG: zinc ribbon domain-containing protein [Clostridiales bacterium]|nr:zinc ribbon domain-containing protein [Clostridiales bacterium]